jgi:hypothetical protein
MAEDTELRQLVADLKQALDRLTKLEKAMVEHVTGSGGTPGALQQAIKRKAGAEDVDKRLKGVTDAIEANGKFDIASREMIDSLTQMMEGDELAPGIRRRMGAIEGKMPILDAMELKMNGDGTESNKGLADRFTRVESNVQTSQTATDATKKTLYTILAVFGGVIASTIGFFWNDLRTDIASNQAEIATLSKQLNEAKVQRAEDIGKLDSLKTRTETDRQWAEKAIDYLKK